MTSEVGVSQSRARLAVRADEGQIIHLLAELNLFGGEEAAELQGLLRTFFAGETSREFWLVDDGLPTGIRGVAYCAPERMTEGTWNLYLIAVRVERRGYGCGTVLLREAENMAASRGGRILLVETSSTADFERTRTFYGKAGYCEVARIPDFYTVGDDKVVFWRSLLSSP